MKYSTFEELPVWRAAIDLALKVFEFTAKADFRGLGDTKSQLERAALSISNNIAEGFERGTTAELINFLYIAKGSAGESRSILRLCERSQRFTEQRSDVANLIGMASNTSRQLHGWIESLKNSDIKGVKFLTEKARAKIERDKEFAEFDREMAEFRVRHEDWLNRRAVDPNAKLE
ncbi:MAG: four helix bundle protein [Pyrinomonadaceae bacterium]